MGTDAVLLPFVALLVTVVVVVVTCLVAVSVHVLFVILTC
jgi:hypothetical protein